MLTRVAAFTAILVLTAGCDPTLESPTFPKTVDPSGALTASGEGTQADAEPAATADPVVRAPAVGALFVRNVAPISLNLSSDGELGFVLPSPAVLACNCPGGHRQLALRGFDGTLSLDEVAGGGRMHVDAWMRGDWNGDGVVSDIRGSFSSDVRLVLREDDVLGLRASGGGEQIAWRLDLSFSRRTNHELKIETMQIAIGPGIFR